MVDTLVVLLFVYVCGKIVIGAVGRLGRLAVSFVLGLVEVVGDVHVGDGRRGERRGYTWACQSCDDFLFVDGTELCEHRVQDGEVGKCKVVLTQ